MKKIKIVVLLLLFTGGGLLIGNVLTKNHYEEELVLTKTNLGKGTFNNRLSMMLENDAGDYVSITSDAWPTTGYKFNSKLSKCANGGKVSWDYANKRVKMTGASSDKCFIYFDKIITVDSYCDSGDNLADCIKSYGDQGYDKSSIYIHNSNLTNGAGDNSYRFAGASDYVNNFVCFGSDASTCPTDNLYRIIGVFGDQVKLIKYDFATSALLGTDGDYYGAYSYDSDTYLGNNFSNIASFYWNYNNDTSINNGKGSNVWSTSLLNTINLNTNFLRNIGISWSNMISNTSWKVGGNTWVKIANSTINGTYQNEIVSPAATTTYSAKIGLMYVSDYGYAASSKYWTYLAYNSNNGERDYRDAINEDWIYMGLTDLTITPNSSYSRIFHVHDSGRIGEGDASSKFAVRPTFFLKSSIKYVSGTGEKNSPYIIN